MSKYKQPIVFYNQKWLLFGFGLCLHPFIFLKTKTGHNPGLYLHEFAHSLQIQKIGYIKFLYIYAIELIKKGYKNNRLEIDAREFSRYHVIEYAKTPLTIDAYCRNLINRMNQQH